MLRIPTTEGGGEIDLVTLFAAESVVWCHLQDAPDSANSQDQVSSATTRDLPSIRTWGQDDASSKQTASKYTFVKMCISHFMKSEGMQPKHKFNDVDDDIGKGTA